MAREMVTLTWCDFHLTEHDEEVEASHFTWDELEVDLCPECAAPLAAAQLMFEKYGSKGPRTMAPPGSKALGSYPCPAPGCGSVLVNRPSLGAHARQMHGVTLGELEGKPIAHTCEECGRGFTTLQGIRLHLRKHRREAASRKPQQRPAAKRAAAAQTDGAP